MNQGSLFFTFLGLALVILACSTEAHRHYLAEEEEGDVMPEKPRTKDLWIVGFRKHLGLDDSQEADGMGRGDLGGRKLCPSTSRSGLRRLLRAAGDDDDGETGGKKKRGKRKKGSSSSTTPAPDGSTTTDSPSTTTTGSPDTSTTGKPKTSTTTKKSSTKSDDLDSKADDEFYKELLKDRDDEEVLISKAAAAIKSWSGWLEAHDKKTLNRNRAQRFLNMVNSQLVNKYHVGSPVGGSLNAPISASSFLDSPRTKEGSRIKHSGTRRHYDFSSLS